MHPPEPAAAVHALDVAPVDASSLRAWLTRCVADHVRCDPASIAADVPLADYGLDSVTALSVGAAIEDEFRISLDANTLWELPTLDALVPELLARIGPSHP